MIAGMRVDVVSIFPDYLAPLDLSLIGRARRDGRLDVGSRPARLHPRPAPNRRRLPVRRRRRHGHAPGTVGRGARRGRRLGQLPTAGVPHLVVPRPAGEPFTQRMAHDLAAEAWLAFACGRYEGIDERVVEDAATRMPVSVVSLGDYVLNGGEVAVLAIVEAVARLLSA